MLTHKAARLVRLACMNVKERDMSVYEAIYFALAEIYSPFIAKKWAEAIMQNDIYLNETLGEVISHGEAMDKEKKEP